MSVIRDRVWTVSRQAANANTRAAISETENLLKIARDNFYEKVAGVVPGLPWDLDDPDADLAINEQDLRALEAELDDAREAVDVALRNLDWETERAFQQLRKALGL